MALGVLNNISAIYAENNLNQTQANLQNTLTQLSSGSRINSGADDAAGLSIANGLQANASALTQSSSNASAGVGFLQVADGALSQVTNLLNRAVTLATEAGGGTLSSSQLSAANQEYQDILTQIGTIGSTTEYNGISVFSAGTPGTATTFSSSEYSNVPGVANGAGAIAQLDVTIGDTLSGTLTLSSSGATASDSVQVNLANYQGLASSDATTRNAAASSLQTFVNGMTGTTGRTYTVSENSSGMLQIQGSGGTTAETLAFTNTGSAAETTATTGGVNIYTSDGTSTGSFNYAVTVGILTDASVGTSDSGSAAGTAVSVTVGGATGAGGTTAGGGAGTSLTGTKLDSQANAEAALQTITNAISAVAYQRGQVGANINTLTAASNIASSEQTNVASAQNSITATDYAAATSNMSKFEILTQTGISALAQANSTQQMVTKLLQ